MRRERRGGDADAEAPQAFKEGASTLRNGQNRIQFSLFCGGVGGLGGGDRLVMMGAKEEGAAYVSVGKRGLMTTGLEKAYYTIMTI